MSTWGKASVIILFLTVLSFNSCTNDNSVAPIYDVDPELIGEWYYTDSLKLGYPSPSLSFTGMQINDDNTIKSLGIETSTGEVKIWDTYQFYKLIKANNNKFIREFSREGTYIDTMDYRVENDLLILSNSYVKYIYKRTKLNEWMTNGIDSRLSIKYNNYVFDTPEISRYPQSFASRTPDDLLIISNNNDYSLNVKIKNFNGVGTYFVKGDEAIVIHKGGDYIQIFPSDSLSENIIEIENDIEMGKCSGKFSFYVNTWYQEKMKVDGIFSLKIF